MKAVSLLEPAATIGTKFVDISADGEINVHFHPGQQAAMASRKRIILVLAGTQGGKTSFGPWWLFNEIYSERGRGAGDYLAVTSTYDLFKLKMLPEMIKVFCDITKMGRYHAGDRVIELMDPKRGVFNAKKSSDSMWGRIILRSANVSSGLESATANAAWLDEAGQEEWTLEAWQAIQRRVALRSGRILITTTPYYFGWLKYEVYDRWLNGDKTIDVINFPSTLNPAFPREEYERARRVMDDWRFDMFYQGLFVKPTGLVYSSFDYNVHVLSVEVVDKLRYTDYVIGIDPGAVNTAVVLLGHTEDDRWVVLEEHLVGDMTTRELANFVRTNFDLPNLSIYGGSNSEKQFRYDMVDNGVYVEFCGSDDVDYGVQRVTELLRDKRLFVSKKCAGLIDEFGSYKRKQTDDGAVMDEIVNKRMYHRLDALRYAVVGIRQDGYPAIF